MGFYCPRVEDFKENVRNCVAGQEERLFSFCVMHFMSIFSKTLQGGIVYSHAVSPERRSSVGVLSEEVRAHNPTPLSTAQMVKKS